jgi:hypothetical protein
MTHLKGITMKNFLKALRFLFFALFILNPYSVLPDETMDLIFDGRAWKNGYEAHNSAQAITEYVLEGETVENWTELVTAHRFLGLQSQVTLKSFMEIMQKDLYRTCPSTRWEIISESPEDLIYSWQLMNCAGQDNQYEIARLILGRTAVHLIRYTHKAPMLDSRRYEIWLALLKNAELKTVSGFEKTDFSEEISLTENQTP